LTASNSIAYPRAADHPASGDPASSPAI